MRANDPNLFAGQRKVDFCLDHFGKKIKPRAGDLGFALRYFRLQPYWLALLVYLRRINSCTRAFASRPPALMAVLEKTNPGPRLLGG